MTDGIFHLVHPHPVKWSTFSSAAAKILGVPSVPYKDWLDILQRAATDSEAIAIEHNPALRLVEFFANYQVGPVLSTERTMGISPTIRDTKQLTGEDVEKWIRNWKKVGFLDN